MNLLFLLQNPVAVGGTYWRARYLAEALVRRGHAVSLLVTAPAARWRWRVHLENAVTVLETPDWLPRRHYGWDPGNALRRAWWAAGRRFDAAYAFETRPVVLASAWALRRQGVPLFFDWCDWLGRGGAADEGRPHLRRLRGAVETFFEERFRHWPRGTTVINQALYDRAQRLGVPAERLLLLRNGTTPPGPPITPAEARLAVGLPETGPIVGFSGRAYPGDAELLRRAFDHLRRAMPGVRLLLAGANVPAWDAAIEKAVIRLPVMAPQALYRYLAACDVCWLPLADTGANRGRLPIKLNDYLHVGRPTVATRVGDVPAVLEPTSAGLVTEPTPEALAVATSALLADRETLHKLGQASRQAAEALTWDRLAERLERFFIKCQPELADQ